MKVEFRTNTLKKNYMDSQLAFKAYGKEVGKKYIQRIGIIQASNNVDEIKAIKALKCHQLKGDRKGEWAVKLTGYMRLIFTLRGKDLEIARIEEVSKHYD